MSASQHPTAPRIRVPRLPVLGPADLSPEGTRHDRTLFDQAELTGIQFDGMTFSDCEFRNVNADELQMEGADIDTAIIRGLDTPIWRAARASVVNVSLDTSRIGLAEFTGATLRSVTFTAIKFGTLDLRGSRLIDARFIDCRFDRIELEVARLTRVSFESCEVSELALTDATADHVDIRGLDVRSISGLDGLRGVTISSAQLTLLAAEYAIRIGVRVLD